MNTNKVLRLYGKKGDQAGFIAEVYVRDNKVRVSSSYEGVKNDLLKNITEAVMNGESFRLPCCIYDYDTIGDGFSLHKLGDPQFLEALQAEFWRTIGLGSPGIFGHRKYGEFTIIAHKSKIIER